MQYQSENMTPKQKTERKKRLQSNMGMKKKIIALRNALKLERKSNTNPKWIVSLVKANKFCFYIHYPML